MAQVKVQAVVAAHAAAGRNHRSLITGLILDMRHEFIDDVTVITFVHVGAVVRTFPFAQPGFVVDAVRRIKLHQALVDEPLAGFDHAEVRIFVVTAAGRWEDDDRFPGMSIAIETHFAVQMAAPL